MKRRDFLRTAASTGVAGVIGSHVGRATAAPPCPPPSLTVDSQTVTTSCVPPPPGQAPSWFLNMTEGTWTEVAGSAGQRIQDCLPSPVPNNGAGQVQGSPDSIATAWTGGAVDQARGEYILAGNGGHADYPGNEAYAISMRDPTPRWRRISDPTPNSSLIFDDAPTASGALNADGRPRAMHSTFECYGDGRVWFPLQNSYASPSGGSSKGLVSYSRDSLGNASTPLPWTGSNLGPWAVHSPINFASVGISDLSSVIFGVGVFDRVGHKVWGLGGNSANYTVYWSVDTTGSTLGQNRVYKQNKSFGHWGGWAVVAHDLRILVAGDHLRNVITVLNLDAVGTANDWQQVSNVTGTGFYQSGAGGVYIPASRSIACGDPRTTGASIKKLQIPTKLSGGNVVYDPAGQWVWSSLNPGGAVPTAAGRAYSKWNIVEDMGNGQSAIVALTKIDGPVYVYKVPLAGV